jgi:arabinan endo-1,5-alpha-L-arabinosidase
MNPSSIVAKLFAAVVLVAQPALGLEGMLGVHDPSTVAKCDGKYYVFGTGRGINILSSPNGFDWQHAGRVFDRIPESVKSYVPKNDGVDVWAPDVVKLNNQYYLYYLFVNHGSCCVGINSTYHIRVGRSKSVTGPYLDRHGDDLVLGAGSLFVASAGKQIGPGHFGWFVDDGVEKFSIHYEGEVGSRGRSFLAIRPLLWSADGWPVAGQDLKAGTYQLCSYRKGDVLQVPPDAATGGRVETAPYLSRTHQHWTLTPAGGGRYRIANAAGSNALQEVTPAADTTKPAARVIMTAATESAQQLWKIDQLPDGTYRIAASQSHLALATPTGPKTGNGLVLEPFTGSAAQRWVISPP